MALNVQYVIRNNGWEKRALNQDGKGRRATLVWNSEIRVTRPKTDLKRCMEEAVRMEVKYKGEWSGVKGMRGRERVKKGRKSAMKIGWSLTKIRIWSFTPWLAYGSASTWNIVVTVSRVHLIASPSIQIAANLEKQEKEDISALCRFLTVPLVR